MRFGSSSKVLQHCARFVLRSWRRSRNGDVSRYSVKLRFFVWTNITANIAACRCIGFDAVKSAQKSPRSHVLMFCSFFPLFWLFCWGLFEIQQFCGEKMIRVRCAHWVLVSGFYTSSFLCHILHCFWLLVNCMQWRWNIVLRKPNWGGMRNVRFYTKQN